MISIIKEFKDIPDYERLYQVSNLGSVKSLKRKGRLVEIMLRQNLDSHGYFCVNLSKNGKYKTFNVATLVAIAFLNHKPNGTNKMVVDHINNNKLDNRAINLQIIPQRENASKDRNGYTSQYIGVCFNKEKCKFVAQIYRKGQVKYLGSFLDEIEASNAYQLALSQI